MEAFPNNATAPAQKIEAGSIAVEVVNFPAVLNTLQEPCEPILYKIRGNPTKPFTRTNMSLQNVDGNLLMAADVAMHITPGDEASEAEPPALAFLKMGSDDKDALHKKHDGLGLELSNLAIGQGRGAVTYCVKHTGFPLYVQYDLVGNEVRMRVANYLNTIDTTVYRLHSGGLVGAVDTRNEVTKFVQRWAKVVEMLAQNGDYSKPPKRSPNILLRPYHDDKVGALALAGAAAEHDQIDEDTSRLTFEKIGGASRAKDKLRKIVAGFKRPEVLEKWGIEKPNGILLYGPPGTGKSSLAKALANELDAEFKLVQASDINNMWHGQSEGNIKRIFKEVKSAESPIVLAFDEFETIITPPISLGSGENRQPQLAVAGVFKTEMDDIAKSNPNLIVLAMSNHKNMIDPSLIRAGRFDAHIYLGLPNEAERTEIWAIKIADCFKGPASSDMSHDSSFRMFTEDIDVTQLSQITENLSGADITTILHNVREDHAYREMQTGQSHPISQQDLVDTVTYYKQS